MPASTDPESTFVAGAYECGVAVRDDGLVLWMTEVGFCTALREPQGPDASLYTGPSTGFRDRNLMVFRGGRMMVVGLHFFCGG